MENKNTELNSGLSGVKVHPNSFVDPSAELHDGVIISQGAIIGPNVTIMEGSRIGSFCKVFPGAVISEIPQDLKFNNESYIVEIGNHTKTRMTKLHGLQTPRGFL